MPENKKTKSVKKTKKNELQSNELIIQHNNLIEAKYRLTLQEKRLMCWLASQVKQTDEDFKEHELTIKDFADLIGIKGDHLYKTVNLVTHKLMQKIITIQSLENKSFSKAALLGGVKYYEGQGIVKLSFHPYLKPYMLQLKERFTQISLGDIIGLKSIHSIRIYELLKQYESIGNREISVNDLRDYCGIKTEQYKKFNSFKKDVLERAEREINNKTDIIIEYKNIKRSRKIIAIEFIIKKNNQSTKSDLKHSKTDKTSAIKKEPRLQNALLEKLKEYGFSRLAAKKFLQQESEEIIENALKAVEIQITKGTVKNTQAMIRTAIQEHWKPDVYLAKKKQKAA